MSATIQRSPYRPVVRVGNWFEDICLDQEMNASFRRLRDSGELLVAKTRKLFDTFHKAVELEAPKENIYFGAIVQLMPVVMDICDQKNTGIYPALSIVITEKVVRRSQQINENCELTVAPAHTPCVRNSFRIIGIDERDRKGDVLKYGEHFRLECVDGQADPLLLYSAQKAANLSSMIPSTYETVHIGEMNLTLGLCSKTHCGPGTMIPSAYTHWTCIHIDPKKRFETKGLPLPSNSPLVISHVPTNRNLAAENIIVQTLFGPEYLVSVQNYRDIYRREKWKNVWMISNGHRESA